MLATANPDLVSSCQLLPTSSSAHGSTTTATVHAAGTYYLMGMLSAMYPTLQRTLGVRSSRLCRVAGVGEVTQRSSSVLFHFLLEALRECQTAARRRCRIRGNIVRGARVLVQRQLGGLDFAELDFAPLLLLLVTCRMNVYTHYYYHLDMSCNV